MDSNFVERMFPILFVGLTAWMGLPWVVIWLSELFWFEIPLWSAWLIFVGPAAIVLTILSVQASMKRQQSRHYPVTSGSPS
jgi:hypothetical protein